MIKTIWWNRQFFFTFFHMRGCSLGVKTMTMTCNIIKCSPPKQLLVQMESILIFVRFSLGQEYSQNYTLVTFSVLRPLSLHPGKESLPIEASAAAHHKSTTATVTAILKASKSQCVAYVGMLNFLSVIKVHPHLESHSLTLLITTTPGISLIPIWLSIHPFVADLSHPSTPPIPGPHSSPPHFI